MTYQEFCVMVTQNYTEMYRAKLLLYKDLLKILCNL